MICSKGKSQSWTNLIGWLQCHVTCTDMIEFSINPAQKWQIAFESTTKGMMWRLRQVINSSTIIHFFSLHAKETEIIDKAKNWRQTRYGSVHRICTNCVREYLSRKSFKYSSPVSTTVLYSKLVGEKRYNKAKYCRPSILFLPLKAWPDSQSESTNVVMFAVNPIFRSCLR